MADTIIAYYSKKKGALLRDLEKTSQLVKHYLRECYGDTVAQELQTRICREYKTLIPEIPHIKSGLRGKMLNTFLLITAQELAVFKAMKQLEKTPSEAWKLCHTALRLRLKSHPAWKKQIIRKLMFSKLMRSVWKKRAENHVVGKFGSFEVEYVVSETEAYHVGINYLKCGNLQFMLDHDGEEFAPYICMSDIALSEELGWGLNRTQTLADGCEYCDFRFCRNSETRITSKTQAVQKTVDEIDQQEKHIM